MATRNEILKAARELGELIAKNDAVRKFEDVIKQLQDDVEAQRILTDHQRALQAVAEKEAANKPIEVEDKRKVEAAQKAVIRHPLLQQLQMVQMDYVDLMREVDAAISGQTEVGDAPAAPGIGGDSPLISPE